MPTAVKEAPARNPADLVNPVVWEDWQAEKARRQERLNKERPRMRECINPDRAAEYEARKPKFRYKVTCTYMLPNKESGIPEEHTKTHEVTAQNERDAWAMFCDRIKHHPSPHGVDRTIEKVGDAY